MNGAEMNIYATTDCVISTQWAYNFIQLKTSHILTIKANKRVVYYMRHDL